LSTAQATRPRKSLVSAVGSTAVTKVAVMGVSGVIGIFNSRLIVEHFGTAAYAQYGLLSALPSLLPFADLGIAAVVINAVAGASEPRTDENVRRTIVTALRILMISAAAIVAVSVLITAFGLWPLLLGSGLLATGGSLAAFLCLATFGIALPLTIGPRVLVGMNRNSTQIAATAVVAPFMLVSILLLIAFSVPAASMLAVLTYVAAGVSSAICVVIAARLLRPQFRGALREVIHPRRFPGVPAIGMAWPMLVQMVALPIAMQTDRLLLSHLTHGPQLAQYNLASQLYGIVISTIAAAGITLWPIYARARADLRIESPLKPTMWFTAGGLAMGLVVAAFTPMLAHFVAGDKIRLDFWLVGGFVVFVALQAAKYPVGMYMTDKRGLTFQVWPILVSVPLNLGLSWWLVGVLGAGGPIIGSAISVAACQLIPNLWYVVRDIDARRKKQAEGLPDAEMDGASRLADE
jgi:O-antigen/teichoic acid export membrane protein